MDFDELTTEEKFLMKIYRNTQDGIFIWEIKEKVVLPDNSGEKRQYNFELKHDGGILTLFCPGKYIEYDKRIYPAKNEEVVLTYRNNTTNACWGYSSKDYSIIRNIYNEIVRKASNIDSYMECILNK